MYNLTTISDVALKKRGKTTRKDSSLAKMHLTKDSNDFKEFRENMKWKTKTYVVNPKYCNATTLPLYFFFGYQILQELKLLQTCGDVSTFFSSFITITLNFDLKKDTDFSELKQLEVYVSPPKNSFDRSETI